MSKPHHLRWAIWLLVAAAIAGVLAAARPVAGDDPHIAYQPVIFRDGPPYPYGLQPGSPTYLSNFLNTSGCNWFGMVGGAFGPDNHPVLGLTVHLEGGGLDVDVVTGSGPPALGPGSYEITLGDHPVATSGVYFIQLRTGAGQPLSGLFMIPTHAECNMNMVLVNFAATLSPPTEAPPPTPTAATPPTPGGTASATPTRAP